MTHASIAVKPVRHWENKHQFNKHFSVYFVEYFYFQQTFSFGDIGCDCVEDVDQDQEDRDEERHPPGDHVRGDEEGDPGDHNEHPGGEITRYDVVRHLPPVGVVEKVQLSKSSISQCF